jgi:D-alanyl-lipoteichoic acid acyltransferase DltB (MBOAT superfamily)
MVTMLLGGLWHGASWNFVIWGGLHGLYLVGYHAWHPWWRRSPEQAPSDVILVRAPRFDERFVSVRRFANGVLVYALVTFTWLFFRSHDIGTTAAYLRGLFALKPGYEGALIPFAVLVLMTLSIDVPQAIADDEWMILEWRLAPRAAFVAASVMVLLLCGNLGHEAFIYFQF